MDDCKFIKLAIAPQGAIRECRFVRGDGRWRQLWFFCLMGLYSCPYGHMVSLHIVVLHHLMFDVVHKQNGFDLQNLPHKGEL